MILIGGWGIDRQWPFLMLCAISRPLYCVVCGVVSISPLLVDSKNRRVEDPSPNNSVYCLKSLLLSCKFSQPDAIERCVSLLGSFRYRSLICEK